MKYLFGMARSKDLMQLFMDANMRKRVSDRKSEGERESEREMSSEKADLNRNTRRNSHGIILKGRKKHDISTLCTIFLLLLFRLGSV